MNLLETKTITLRTISPIHIKGKDIDYGHGFVRRDDQTAYAIDSNKLAEFLYSKTNNLSLVTKYVNEIEKYSSENKLKEFDNEKFLYENGIYHHKKNRIREKELIEYGVFKAVVNAPSEGSFIRKGYGKPFIPGSSIKGVLRTAVMYNLTKYFLEQKGDNPVKIFLKNISNEISTFEERTQGKSKRHVDIEKRKFSQEIQRYIFQNRQMGINTKEDFFRCVKVKDSEDLSKVVKQRVVLISLKEPVIRQPVLPKSLVGEIGTIIRVNGGIYVEHEGENYSFTNKIYNKQSNFLKEIVGKNIRILQFGSGKVSKFEIAEEVEKEKVLQPAKSSSKKYPINFKLKDIEEPVDFEIETFSGTIDFTTTLDTYLLAQFKEKNDYIPFSNIEQLFSLVKIFSEDLWQYERSFFDSCTDEQLGVSFLRNFYGSKQIENKFRIGWGTGLTGMTINMLLDEHHQKELRNRLFTDRDDLPAPKSRRLTYENDELKFPLGWVEFKIRE